MTQPSTTSRGEDRQSLLGRVRSALNRTQTVAPAEPAPAIDERIARLARPTDDLASLFADRAQVVGMVVHRVTRAQQMPRLLALLQQSAARKVVVGFGDAEQQREIDSALNEAGVAVMDWAKAEGLDGQYDADAGITDVHAALAETGTLICCSDARHSRGLSLVPPVHVAIVRRSDIVADMIDFWVRYRGQAHTQLPSSIAFITGPSKTADIEGELVQGVHGPGQVHIVLVEDA